MSFMTTCSHAQARFPMAMIAPRLLWVYCALLCCTLGGCGDDVEPSDAGSGDASLSDDGAVDGSLGDAALLEDVDPADVPTDARVADATTLDDGSARDAGPSAASSYYGNPQGARSLANTTMAIGGSGVTNGLGYSNRVIFPFSGELVAVRKYHIWSTTRPGYHRGDGGTVEYRFCTDDGTSDHFPTEEVLARTGDIIGAPELYEGPAGPIDNPYDEREDFRRIDFREPITVAAGEIYHLTVWNTSDDPATRAVGMDDFISGSGGPAAQLPMQERGNWGVLIESGGEWTERDNFWMITEFIFADGRTWGNGYMETSATGRPDRVYRIDGDLAVRENFVVSGGDRRASAISFRARRESGSGAVEVTVREGGDVIWSGSVDASEYPRRAGDPSREATFASTAIEPAIVLRNGEAYSVEFATSAGSVYAVPGMRDGAADSWFSPATTFSDGHAEYREGGGDWTGWTTWSADDTERQDLSFYFGL